MSPIKNETFDESTERNGKRNNRFYKTAIYFRWLFIAFILPVFLYVSENTASTIAFFETLAITVIYNIFVSMYLSKAEGEKKDVCSFISAADVILISIFSYLLGGINSDIYILMFFIIGYCGVCSEKSRIVYISVFSIISYTAATILWVKNYNGDFSYWSLALRDLFIAMAAIGISFIAGEARKYNEMHKKEFKLARTDKLTGLANRHYLEQKLHEEAECCDFSGEPLNILIFDLDNFKKFNDTYGHIWGDKLLSLFSDIIKQNVRKTDIPVRYGGEEFLIMIRGLDIEIAKSVGDRIRRQLEKQRIYVGSEEQRKRVTVSCGVAQYPKHSSSVKEVIDLADKALYHAKEIGKNIVVGFDDIGKIPNAVQMDIDMYMER